MQWKILLVFWLSFCNVVQVLRSFGSWACSDFQGTPRIHLGEVFYVHQVIKQIASCCFPMAIELCSSRTGSVRRNWVPGHLGDGEAQVSLHPVGWAHLRVLSWPQCAARVQCRLSVLVNAHFELPIYCTEITVHTAVPGASQWDNLLL